MTTAQRQPAGAGSAGQRKMKVGVVGLGAGAVQVVRAMQAAPYLELVAGADVRPEALTTFKERFNGRTYDSVEKLCADPEVEVVWVSTPNQFHCEHTLIAARAGKHIVCEKPMALNLEQAGQMVEAAEKNRVKLLCGHTASLMAVFRTMHKVVRSGEIGPVRAINAWAYTDWMFRPRMAQELDLATGGGVPYRQGPHQLDIVRLMGGGRVRSVRAGLGQWMDFRPAPGFYSAFLEFEDGTPATVVYNGYGYFSIYEFVPWAGQSRFLEESRRIRAALREGKDSNDAAAKNDMRFGGKREEDFYGPPGETEMSRTGFQGDAGIIIVSGEKGDVRQSANGLTVYDDNGPREVPVEGLKDERMAELWEMYEAITEDRPVRHDGRWGMATLELILAIMQSGRERREIKLQHQVPVWDW